MHRRLNIDNQILIIIIRLVKTVVANRQLKIEVEEDRKKTRIQKVLGSNPGWISRFFSLFFNFPPQLLVYNIHIVDHTVQRITVLWCALYTEDSEPPCLSRSRCKYKPCSGWCMHGGMMEDITNYYDDLMFSWSTVDSTWKMYNKVRLVLYCTLPNLQKGWQHFVVYGSDRSSKL